MTTRQCFYLVTISDSGNLSTAAQILGISQPALSKFLSNYEASLGFLIFFRYHKQLTPTAVGRYIIECAQKILDEQTRLLHTLRSVTGSQHTHIRLATAPNRGAIIYSRIYKQFSHRYPDIALSLSEIYATDQPGAILHGQIDLAIGAGKTSEKVTDLPFAYEELLVSLPASHPLAGADHIRLTDLRDTPFVLQGSRHSIRILADDLFREAGFSPVVAFESNDVMLVDSMLHQAVGAGLVSQAHVFPCSELVYRSLEPPIHQTLHIRYPLNHTLTEPERYLAGLLIHERLSDSRYKAIPSSQAEELFGIASHTEDAVISNSSTVFSKPFSEHGTGNAPSINLDTQLLKYIIAIADEKSLTKAAEVHYLTQPALSRYLRNVENMLHTQLFTRIHNRLQPTNAGKIFNNFSRNILQMEHEMAEQLHAYRIGHGGGIFLQCDSSLLPVLNQQVLPEFQKQHPDVKLSIIGSDRGSTQTALLNASTDFGLFFASHTEHPILNCEPVFCSELVYCFHQNSSCTIPKALNNMQNFPSHPIMLAAKDTCLRLEQEKILSELSDHSYHVVCEGTIDVLKHLAESGIADVILPKELLSPEALKRSVPFQTPRYFYLLLAHHPGRTLPSSVHDLTALIYAHLTTSTDLNFSSLL